MNLREHPKQSIENQEFSTDVIDADFSKKDLSRIYAVKRIFTDVSFKQSVFFQCYFRNCRFIRCDFTGASIEKSNFRGSQYEDCKFQYSTWENTQVDGEILNGCLPSEENLARDLARSLRVNFGHIGNYPAVNKAAAIEVSLTGQHFYNAAYSKQSYYRNKYKGWDRVSNVLKHAKWKALDLLWGNGESIGRVFFSGFSILLLGSIILAWKSSEFTMLQSVKGVFMSFFNVTSNPSLPTVLQVGINALHLLLVGLFMAILIKRLARR